MSDAEKIPTACTNCGQRMKIKAAHRGKKVRCPVCKEPFVVTEIAVDAPKPTPANPEAERRRKEARVEDTGGATAEAGLGGLDESEDMGDIPDEPPPPPESAPAAFDEQEFPDEPPPPPEPEEEEAAPPPEPAEAPAPSEEVDETGADEEEAADKPAVWEAADVAAEPGDEVVDEDLLAGKPKSITVHRPAHRRATNPLAEREAERAAARAEAEGGIPAGAAVESAADVGAPPGDDDYVEPTKEMLQTWWDKPGAAGAPSDTPRTADQIVADAAAQGAPAEEGQKEEEQFMPFGDDDAAAAPPPMEEELPEPSDAPPPFGEMVESETATAPPHRGPDVATPHEPVAMPAQVTSQRRQPAPGDGEAWLPTGTQGIPPSSENRVEPSPIFADQVTSYESCLGEFKLGRTGWLTPESARILVTDHRVLVRHTKRVLFGLIPGPDVWEGEYPLWSPDLIKARMFRPSVGRVLFMLFITIVIGLAGYLGTFAYEVEQTRERAIAVGEDPEAAANEMTYASLAPSHEGEYLPISDREESRAARLYEPIAKATGGCPYAFSALFVLTFLWYLWRFKGRFETDAFRLPMGPGKGRRNAREAAALIAEARGRWFRMMTREPIR